VTVEGEHYRVAGAKPGPQPAHPIGLWIGAYGPRMLSVTGRLADGWLPSLGRLDVDAIAAMHARVDEAAKRAGRDPGEIKRVANTTALEGRPGTWAGQLSRAAQLGFETLIVPVPEDDPVGFIRRLGEDVAPGIR